MWGFTAILCNLTKIKRFEEDFFGFWEIVMNIFHILFHLIASVIHLYRSTDLSFTLFTLIYWSFWDMRRYVVFVKAAETQRTFSLYFLWDSVTSDKHNLIVKLWFSSRNTHSLWILLQAAPVGFNVAQVATGTRNFSDLFLRERFCAAAVTVWFQAERAGWIFWKASN